MVGPEKKEILASHSIFSPTHVCPDGAFLQALTQFAYLFADIQMLVEAEVFVGTYTSNIGRLVFLLRDAIGKPRESTINLEGMSWWPGGRFRE